MYQVSLTFDDGWDSAARYALPILREHQKTATFYIISERLDVNRFPEYLNAEDLEVFTKEGHEIGSHTRSHKHLPELQPEEAWREITEGRDDLRSLGVEPRTFAYPFGDWNPAIVKQVREAGFFAARSIVEGYNDEFTNHLLLRTMHVVETTTLKQIRAWIDEAQRRSAWLILMFHQIEEPELLRLREWIYGATPEILDDTLCYLKKSGAAVVTVYEGLHRMTL